MYLSNAIQSITQLVCVAHVVCSRALQLRLPYANIDFIYAYTSIHCVIQYIIYTQS